MKIWDFQPLHTSIIETLLKKGGALTDKELYQALKKSWNELSYRELNKMLMRLEVNGIIQVFTLTKKKKRVELKNI